MTYTETANVVLVTVTLASLGIHLAWARAMQRSAHATGEWFQLTLAAKGAGPHLGDYPPVREAERALARLRPWETVARVGITAAILNLAVALILS
ncbi:hypothetical protein [Streptomyces albogriseolus]|uniref:hypothetical protein n=1 Tax=Streptomyces albogriseolus TaxID=1887 RepID=UPI0034602EE6